jgi:hypothetical protein
VTRRSRTNQSVERRLASLEAARTDDDSADMVAVLWRDERTGDLVDRDGTPTDPDPDTLMVVINRSVVMPRERAEEQGREILGPATDTPAENDAVRVVGGSP